MCIFLFLDLIYQVAPVFLHSSTILKPFAIDVVGLQSAFQMFRRIFFWHFQSVFLCSKGVCTSAMRKAL